MNTLSKILVATIFLFGGSPAFAQTKEEPKKTVPISVPKAEPAPKQTVEECLGAIWIEYKGEKRSLTKGTHFKPSEAQDDPDKFGRTMLIKEGLLTHPAWAPKASQIQKCLDDHGMKAVEKKS
jgi:hypothetical protein